MLLDLQPVSGRLKDSSRLPSLAMTAHPKNFRYGVTPVMSQAGVVPGPNASMKMGPPSTTSGHPRSRFIDVRQRRRYKERKKKPKPEKLNNQEKQQSCINILQANVCGISKKRLNLHNYSARGTSMSPLHKKVYTTVKTHTSATIPTQLVVMLKTAVEAL